MAELSLIGPFVLIVMLAVYMQTVTGFGLGMIIMGLASGLNILPVVALAAVIGLVTVVNSAGALKGRMLSLQWPIALSMIVGVLPASVLGVVLLNYLSSEATDLLQVLLGVVIVIGGLNLAWKPKALPVVSGMASFAWYGFLGGLIGGMFGIPGPPLIYQLYRQPLSMAEIRNQLILMNLVIAGARSLFAATQGDLSGDILLLSGICLPVVALTTYLGRRYPPPLQPHVLRRLAFIVLVLMGLGLILPALG